MKILINIASILLFSSYSFAEDKINICSITINSDTEINVFKNTLDQSKFNFIELAADPLNPKWLQNACEQKVKCDSLVISGHFGGIFFSETNSLTLDLEEMLTKSCNNKCSGVFQNTKEVYLLGCNTLANKEPDHRTYTKYLQVLVNDGISREYAEPIVATRYLDHGITIESHFRSVFPNAKKIYGFKSTGPTGAQSAGKLQSYLNSIPNYVDFLNNLTADSNNQPLADNYARTSMVQTSGISLSKDSKEKGQRDLLCKIYSEDIKVKNSGLNEIIQCQNYDLFFNTLLSSNQKDFMATLDDIQKASIKAYLDDIFENYSGLREIQYRALKSLSLLNITKEDEFTKKLNDFLENVFSTQLDSLTFDQVCTIAKNEPELTFKNEWIAKYSLDQSIYLPRLVSCFSKRENEVNESLKNMYALNQDPRVKIEIIRTIPNFAPADEVVDPELKHELINSTTSLKSRNLLRAKLSDKNFINCINKSSDHWTCWNTLQKQGKSNLEACLYGADNSAGSTKTGLYWQCLTNFPNEITITDCINASKTTQDSKTSDDMKWFCWDKLKDQNRINRSECFGLARSMVIKGNRIKENWNCNNKASE